MWSVARRWYTICLLGLRHVTNGQLNGARMATKATDRQWTAIGLAVGAGLGLIVGLLVSGGLGIGLGLALGAGVGSAIGASLDSKKPEER